jgi:hypothetical protein
MDKILDNKKLFNHCGDARLVGKSLRELMNMKKGEDEEFSFCAYVGTTMQLLDKEFLRWLLERGAQPANLSKLIRDAQARKEAGTFWARILSSCVWPLGGCAPSGYATWRTVFCARR